MVTKILVFLLVLSVLEVVREFYNLIMAFMKAEKFNWTLARGIEFMLAVSYLFTIIFTGLGV